MDVQKIVRRRRNGSKKNILVTIRIDKKLSNWLKEKNYSPTGIFYEAIKDLGFNDGGEDKENV